MITTKQCLQLKNFVIWFQVNIYANNENLVPIGNPPLAGDQVRLCIYIYIYIIIILKPGWRILWLFYGSSWLPRARVCCDSCLDRRFLWNMQKQVFCCEVVYFKLKIMPQINSSFLKHYSGCKHSEDRYI